jgi:predicted O-linked N-acetylglucosamine transferase (SPINDLY family)
MPLVAVGRRPSPTPRSASSRTRRTRRRSEDLSTAQQAAGNTDGAIEALGSYTQLRPKDTDALRELAALYLQKASAAQERAQIYQARSDYFAPGAIRDTLFQFGGSPLRADPITSAVSTSYEQQISAAASEIQSASALAVEQYRKITVASRRIRASSSSSRRRRSPRTTSRRRSPPTRRS